MQVGIIGLGVVGDTLDYGFTRLGHDVYKHDIKLGTNIHDVLAAELVFVCVPTPSAPDGSCDVAVVDAVVAELAHSSYKGLVVIKSTVTPGTTDRLQKQYPMLRLAFCPEFLREKSTYSDFVENHDVLIYGTYNAADACLINQVHGHYPKQLAWVRPLEAELCKYFSNTFNALRIVFANQFFEVCEAVGADYNTVKNAISKRTSIGGHYLDCNKNFRAFGGSCLPKDTAALAAFVRERGIDAELFQWLLDANAKLQQPRFKEAAE